MGMERATDRLFLAVVPPADIAVDIADVTRRLRIELKLLGRPLATEHFHVTALHVGDGVGLPHEAIHMGTHIGAQVTLSPFRVRFDQVMSFSNGALVLCSGDGVAGLELLHERLAEITAKVGLKRRMSAYTPHITLLRDNQVVPKHPIEPIEWTVREFVLVHSLLGRTIHRHLVRFPLIER